MSCLSRNCQGLGNPRTIRDLQQMVKEKSPSFIFLIETKCTRNKVEKVRNGISFEHNFVDDNKGLSGGLAFQWKYHIKVAINSYTQNHISLRDTDSGSRKNLLLTVFMGIL